MDWNDGFDSGGEGIEAVAAALGKHHQMPLLARVLGTSTAVPHHLCTKTDSPRPRLTDTRGGTQTRTRRSTPCCWHAGLTAGAASLPNTWETWTRF